MIDYCNGVFCVEANWLFSEGAIMSFSQYKHLVADKKINIIQRGCRNTPAKVEYDSIPSLFLNKIEKLYGNLKEKKVATYMELVIVRDEKAREFYSNWVTPNNSLLDWKVANKYSNNAELLNACGEVLNSKIAKRRGAGRPITGLWDQISENINNLDKKKYNHSLPTNPRRLADLYNKYKKDGYRSLIHGNFGNINTRKVDEKLERLILSIYCKGNKPYASWVHEDYMLFLSGQKYIIDIKTGELFDREDFRDEKKGTYIMISESTCWNYINNPQNRAIIDAIRMNNHKYIGNIRPHMHRKNAEYGLSKISLDDRDLPRKMHDGTTVKAYYAYDVASGCLIGAAYSKKKDANLFLDCLRDMFWFIDQRNWGMPIEVEVEHHIVGLFKEDLMMSEVVFPIVTFCAPGNSQEKHAEQFNRQKKYGYEKRYQDGIGRFYLKDDSNVPNGDRVYDDTLDKYVIRTKTYDYEELVADDRATIEAYNNGLHRDQKQYKGKTRMQVLVENLNPNLAQINRAILIRYIGICTKTSIQRNHYLQVQYADYALPSPEFLRRLKPNNYNVDAYWLPYSDMGEVVIYQEGNYIATCKKIEKFTTAHAEWQESDDIALANQAKYIAQYDKMVKEGKNNMANIQIQDNLSQYNNIVAETVTEVEEVVEESFDFDMTGYAQRAFEGI